MLEVERRGRCQPSSPHKNSAGGNHHTTPCLFPSLFPGDATIFVKKHLKLYFHVIIGIFHGSIQI